MAIRIGSPRPPPYTVNSVSLFCFTHMKEGETMYHHLFRITLLVAATAVVLVACAAQNPTAAPTTKAPIATTKAVPTATEIAPTNTPEPTATQVVLGSVTGRIAFVSNRDGNDEIYIMNGDGSGLTNLTNNPAGDGAPVWSPDGKKIAFGTDRDGN